MADKFFFMQKTHQLKGEYFFMNKNLISRLRAKAILKLMKESGFHYSDCINEALINDVLPAYITQLQVYVVCLIDIIKHQKHRNELAIQASTIEMLWDCLEWFKNGHHLHSCDTLKILLNFFCLTSWFGGSNEEELTNQEKKKIDEFLLKLQKADPDISDTFNGWGDLAAKVLNHWNSLWDCDWAYDVLIYMLRKEHAKEYMNPLAACFFVKDLEKQYLLEQAHLN